MIAKIVNAALFTCSFVCCAPASAPRDLESRTATRKRSGPALARDRPPFAAVARVAAAGVPGSPNVFYFSSRGRRLKTIDAGATWKLISMPSRSPPSVPLRWLAAIPTSSMSAPAGEYARRRDLGRRCVSTTDAGKTWTDLGLADTRQIGAIIVDPADPDVVLVAAVGHAFGPNTQRGVFRSSDGQDLESRALQERVSWRHDLAADRAQLENRLRRPWQVRRQPWISPVADPAADCIAR